MPPKRLLNTVNAKRLRKYRADASPNTKARWNAERSERRRQQKARAADCLVNNDVEKDKREKHAQAQARYIAKKRPL